MTGKARDAEFRHPEAVAYLESLTDEEAAKHPPLIREHDGVATRYWREGGRVRCRLPRLESLPSRSRLTQKYKPHPVLRIASAAYCPFKDRPQPLEFHRLDQHFQPIAFG